MIKSETRSTSLESRNSKQEIRNKFKAGNSKRYDLEDRALRFAKDVRTFVRILPKDTVTQIDIKQLVRSSGSIGANYLEANESLSKKDFQMRLKIAKKEARETIWWLELPNIPNGLGLQHKILLQEATELMNILGAITRKTA